MLTQAVDGKPGRPAMPPTQRNFADDVNGVAGALLAAPVVGLMAAGALALGGRNRRKRIELSVLADPHEIAQVAAPPSSAPEDIEREV